MDSPRDFRCSWSGLIRDFQYFSVQGRPVLVRESLDVKTKVIICEIMNYTRGTGEYTYVMWFHMRKKIHMFYRFFLSAMKMSYQ